MASNSSGKSSSARVFGERPQASRAWTTSILSYLDASELVMTLRFWEKAAWTNSKNLGGALSGSESGVNRTVALSTFGRGVKCSGPIFRSILQVAWARIQTVRLP